MLLVRDCWIIGLTFSAMKNEGVDGSGVGLEAEDYSMLLVRMLLDNWINISSNTE